MDVLQGVNRKSTIFKSTINIHHETKQVDKISQAVNINQHLPRVSPELHHMGGIERQEEQLHMDITWIQDIFSSFCL